MRRKRGTNGVVTSKNHNSGRARVEFGSPEGRPYGVLPLGRGGFRRGRKAFEFIIRIFIVKPLSRGRG
jgi:hypothetical protein